MKFPKRNTKYLYVLAVLVSLVVIAWRLNYVGNLNNLGVRRDLGAEIVEDKPVRFAILSDIHSDTENLQKALKKIDSDKIEFLIITGDLTTVGTKSELQKIESTLSEKTRKYFVIPGNHDLWTSGRIKQDLFGEVFGKRYQAFRLEQESGRVKEQEIYKFILIDNGDWRGIDGGEVGSGRWDMGREVTVNSVSGINGVKGSGNQWEWIEKETEECLKIMCLVFMHMPLNHPQSKHIMGEDSISTATQAARLVDLLVKNKVRQVFAGHLHYSSNYEIDGLKTQVVGSLAKDRNWQIPRYLEVEVLGNEVKTKEVEIE